MVNGKRISSNITVHEQDTIRIYLADTFFEPQFHLPKESFSILYEDTNILVINKPINLEVTGENSLTTLLQEQYKTVLPSGFPSPCHRLDRNTQGLVLYAKNALSLEILLEKFKHHEIEKIYLCKVYGIPKKDKDTCTAYLFKDQKKSQVYIKDTPQKGYQTIITSYQILKKNLLENTSILEVNLQTGKTHQIRAHLAYLGYPIIGDR